MCFFLMASDGLKLVMDHKNITEPYALCSFHFCCCRLLDDFHCQCLKATLTFLFVFNSCGLIIKDAGRIFCVMLILTLLWHQCLLLHLIMVTLTCPLISPLMPSVCGTYFNKNSTLGWNTSAIILLETTPASKPIKVGQLVVKLGYFWIHWTSTAGLPCHNNTHLLYTVISYGHAVCTSHCFNWW